MVCYVFSQSFLHHFDSKFSECNCASCNLQKKNLLWWWFIVSADFYIMTLDFFQVEYMSVSLLKKDFLATCFLYRSSSLKKNTDMKLYSKNEYFPFQP